MLEAKEGKIDIDFFKSIVQKKEITENRIYGSGDEPEDMKVKYISGWILKFFGYWSERDDTTGKLKIFNEEKIEIDDFRKLSYQMIKVPFKIIDEVNQKEYDAKYEVGFIGCDKNEKNEVFPVEGWIFSILNKKQNKEEEQEQEKEKNCNIIDEKRENEEEEDDEEEEEEKNSEEKEREVELENLYKEMEEDEDKLGSINDYYLNRIKFPGQFGDFEEYEEEEEKEEEEEHEDGQYEQENVENEQEGKSSKKV